MQANPTKRGTVTLRLLGAVSVALLSTALAEPLPLSTNSAIDQWLALPSAPQIHALKRKSPLLPVSALVIVQAGDVPQNIAERYNVGASALSIVSEGGEKALPTTLQVGQVVRVVLPLGRQPRRPASIKTVIVKAGQTLSQLMQRYNLTERELISANLELGSLDQLQVGDTLNIPTAEKGLLIRIKAGQTAAGLITAYRAEPRAVARVNQFTLPTELSAGDELLLPNIYADSRREELLARRERTAQQAKAAQVLARYQAFEAWKEARLKERQRRYDAYQAWLNSPERLAMVSKYQRQAKYDVWMVKQAKEAAKREAEYQAVLVQQAKEAAKREAEYQAFLTQQAEEAAAKAQDLKRQILDLAASDPRPQLQAALNAEQTAPDLQLIWPLNHPRLTSRFGEEDTEFHSDIFHGGLDMADATGTPIYAAQDGQVTQSGEGSFGTNVYTVDAELNLTIVYGHLSAVAVDIGQSVKQGDLIGYVGCTGECSGPHLHFELRLGGVPIDPLAFLPQ